MGVLVQMLPVYANGHISAAGDPIHFMFGPRVGFPGSADRMALFPVTISATAYSIHLIWCASRAAWSSLRLHSFLVQVHFSLYRTNGRAYYTVLRPSVVVVCL